MPKPRNGKGRKASSLGHNWLPTIPVLLILILVAGIFYATQLSRQTYTPVDQTTFCRTDRAPTAVTVVLLDLTDALAREEKTQIGYEFARLQSLIPRHGLLEVYFLHRDLETLREPVFRACNPGDGSDMNPLYQNPQLARQRWEQGFIEKLDYAFETSYGLDASDRSLILEAIRLLAINAFSQPAFDGAQKTLIIISDLLQHNPDKYTHYRSPIESFTQFSRTDYFHQARTDLRDVNIQIVYLTRPATRQFQARAHVEFWLAYFESAGARVLGVKRLLGD